MSQSDYDKLYGERSIKARKNALINKQKNETITVDELRELNNILSTQNVNKQFTKNTVKKIKSTSSIIKDISTITLASYKLHKIARPIIQSLHDKYSGKID